MAAAARKLTVKVSTAALRTLEAIHEWNVRQFGRDHANRYIQFLNDQTDKLATEYMLGRPVTNHPHLVFKVFRLRRGGYGHVIVYELADDSVLVLDYFHTAQDWPAKLA